MKYERIIILLTILGLAGCATTQRQPYVMGSQNLSLRVSSLEKKLAQKDQEIEALKYEIKDLSAQVESLDLSPVEEVFLDKKVSSQKNPTSSSKKFGKKSDDRVVLVPVGPQDIQRALQNAGYYDGAIDGKIGPKTRAAITIFQKEHDLKDDGLVGQKTWSEMKNYLE